MKYVLYCIFLNVGILYCVAWLIGMVKKITLIEINNMVGNIFDFHVYKFDKLEVILLFYVNVERS